MFIERSILRDVQTIPLRTKPTPTPCLISVHSAKVQLTQQRVVRSRQTVRCMASNEAQNRRQVGLPSIIDLRSLPPQLLGLGAALAATVLAPAAKADLVSDLLEKSKANKAENDKKRLLASYANVERSRTVSDGSCAVPNNFLGCGGTQLYACTIALSTHHVVYRKPRVYQGQVHLGQR